MTWQQRPQEGGRQEQTIKGPRFGDILDIAWTQHGLKRVSTEIVQLPNEANKWTTIVHATVETDRGVFEAIGDANPENSGRAIAPHAIRFAESRAIARALRWATNAGEALDVEMGDYAPEHPSAQTVRPGAAPPRGGATGEAPGATPGPALSTPRPVVQRPANVDADGVVADPMAALWGKVDTAVRMLQTAGVTQFQAPAKGSDQVTIEVFLADARGALANAHKRAST